MFKKIFVFIMLVMLSCIALADVHHDDLVAGSQRVMELDAIPANWNEVNPLTGMPNGFGPSSIPGANRMDIQKAYLYLAGVNDWVIAQTIVKRFIDVDSLPTVPILVNTTNFSVALRNGNSVNVVHGPYTGLPSEGVPQELTCNYVEYRGYEVVYCPCFDSLVVLKD